MSYRKHGGLHFVRIGRLALSFAWCKGKRKAKPRRIEITDHDIEAFDIEINRGLQELICATQWEGQGHEHS